MPRSYNRTGRTKGLVPGTFSLIRHDIVKSPAFRSLPPVPRAIWLELMLRFKGHNNGDIPLSCREVAESLNISKNTASRGFDLLQDRGLTRIGQDSSFTVKTRLSRRWTLTHESVGNRLPTNDWRSWEPPEKQNTVTPEGHTVSEIGP